MRRSLRAVLPMVVALILWPTATASAHAPYSQAGYIDYHLHLFRVHTNKIRVEKCHAKYRLGLTALELSTLPYGSPERESIITTWTNRHARAHELGPCIPRLVIRRVFEAKAPAALSVARCESHLDPRAVGKARERGLFQIHPIHRSWLGPLWARLFHPRVNAEVAWRMSKHGTDWGPWTCKP
jgi:hypothetical protein